MKRIIFSLFLVLASSPLSALAQEEPPTELSPPVAVAPVPTPVPAPESSAELVAPVAKLPRQDLLRVSLGPRWTYIDDPGLDRFATTDTFRQFSFDATVTLLRRGRVAVAAGAAWDIGSRGDGARQIATNLTVHRLTVPVEGRYHVLPWLYGFARVAPGAAAMMASVEESSAAHRLEGTSWAFAADASLGASIRVASGTEARWSPHLWITPEIGYAYTTRVDLVVDPNRDDKDILGGDAQTKLGSLALRGVFWRLGASLTF